MAPKGSPPISLDGPPVPSKVPGRSKHHRLEDNKGEVIGMLAIGTPKGEIIRTLDCHWSALWNFEKRHRAEIDVAIEKRNQRLEDYYIARQIDRVAELQWWYDKTKAEADKYDVAQDDIQGIREYRATMVKEARGLLRDAAEELGQIKQPAKQEISTHQTYVLQLVRNDHSDIPQLG